MKKLLYFASLAVLLAACSKPHDVAYFKANIAERELKLTECRGQAGAFDSNQECVSAWLAMDVQPVSYWRDHSAERAAMTGQCKEHAATIGKSANCENAGRAQTAVMGSGTPVYLPTAK
jgi:hypothetical protein